MPQFDATIFIRKLALLVVCLMLSAHQAAAKDEKPEQFLQEIYKSYTGKNPDGVRWRGPEASRYFDARLTKLILEDLKETDGGIGRMDADPFIDAQDFRIRNLRIDIVTADADKAKAMVSFVNLSQPTKIAFDLAMTRQGWRIANITWPQWNTDFVSIMSGPLVSE